LILAKSLVKSLIFALLIDWSNIDASVIGNLLSKAFNLFISKIFSFYKFCS
jgi:hypothetical protein